MQPTAEENLCCCCRLRQFEAVGDKYARLGGGNLVEGSAGGLVPGSKTHYEDAVFKRAFYTYVGKVN